ncbi:MAG: GDSL-type esterase/lipase family protein [Acidimicrobiia bacterium]
MEVGRGGDVGDGEGRAPAVEPFVRGCAWPAGAGASYPRANPADFARLPIDTWGTAQLPVGVRLELVGDATAIELDYRTETDDFGYRGEGAGKFFTVVRDDAVVDEQPAVLGSGTVRLSVVGGGDRAIVYLPEGMKPTVDAIRAVDGSIEPAPGQPRWLCYGDSIAEGWIASGPAGAWPAVAGRVFGLDAVNLGYAGSARGEIVSAEHIAGVAADVISISHGTNCWTRIQHSAGQMRENTRAFLTLVRAGHPGIPIVVCSPVIRPDAEATANALGATLADLRAVIEEVTREQIDAGDTLMSLVLGEPVIQAEHLADGVHPGDEGQRIIAATFGAAVREALDTNS